MGVFYILHHILPETDRFKDGKRNCATFLFGVGIYSVLYIILKNLQLRYGSMMDAFVSALFVIVIADAAVMGFIYKQYYGRSILNEIGDDQGEWRFDPATHKYVRASESEKLAVKYKNEAIALLRKEQYELQLEQLKRQLEGSKKARTILENKERIRAAKVIQRWWRTKLYSPPDGVFYKRALESFRLAQSQ